MSDRFTRIEVVHSRGKVEMPWDAREKLVRRLRHLDGAKPIVARFEKVETDEPLELGQYEKGFLVVAVNAWMADVGRDRVPGAVVRIRDAFLDDLNEPGGVPEPRPAVDEPAVAPDDEGEPAAPTTVDDDAEAQARLESLLGALERELEAVDGLRDPRLDRAIDAVERARAEIRAAMEELEPPPSGNAGSRDRPS